jgi:hypothetical protein
LLASALEAMASPVAVRGIPMQVFAAPIKGEAPNAVVAIAIELNVNGFGFLEGNGSLNDRLELSLSAVDTQGKPRASASHTVNLAMKPDTLARARSRGFRVLSELALPPGRYQLRIAAAEGGASRSGSVVADIDVPDFYKPELAMSALAVTSLGALDSVTVAAKDPFATFLPAPLVAVREFSRNDTLALFAEFYENLSVDTPPHKVDVTTTIRSDDGRVVAQAQEEMQSTELVKGKGGFGFSTRIPLNTLEPGLYVVHIEGRSRATKLEAGIGRDVLIRVR